MLLWSAEEISCRLGASLALLLWGRATPLNALLKHAKSAQFEATAIEVHPHVDVDFDTLAGSPQYNAARYFETDRGQQCWCK